MTHFPFFLCVHVCILNLETNHSKTALVFHSAGLHNWFSTKDYFNSRRHLAPSGEIIGSHNWGDIYPLSSG